MLQRMTSKNATLITKATQNKPEPGILATPLLSTADQALVARSIKADAQALTVATAKARAGLSASERSTGCSRSQTNTAISKRLTTTSQTTDATLHNRSSNSATGWS